MSLYAVYIDINAVLDVEADSSEEAIEIAERSIRGYEIVDWTVVDAALVHDPSDLTVG